MVLFSRSILFWAPRAIAILFIAFVSMFALDVFDEGLGFRQTAAALFMHLIPVFVMAAGLALAWRWEWVGAALFTACAAASLAVVRGPWWVKGMFVLPCLAAAGLFLLNWLKRERRAA